VHVTFAFDLYSFVDAVVTIVLAVKATTSNTSSCTSPLLLTGEFHITDIDIFRRSNTNITFGNMSPLTLQSHTHTRTKYRQPDVERSS